jgi:hypothetical protein
MGKEDVNEIVSTCGQSALDGVLSASIAENKKPTTAPKKKSAQPRKAKRTNMENVKPESVVWLWDRRIARGKFTLIDGDPGEGKSLITLDVAARLSTGRPMPGEETATYEASKVLFLLCEDDLGDTVAPRLIAAGADRRNIEVITDLLSIPKDLEVIESAISDLGAVLVVLDPLNAYIDGQTNTHNDHQVRAALTPLVQMAARLSVAVVGVRHFNKQQGGPAKYRGGGSIAYIGLARSALMVGIDPEDEASRILASSKGNLSTRPHSLRFSIVETEDKQPRIEWKGPCNITADQLCALPEKEDSPSSRQDARDFLFEQLADGEKYTDEIYRDAKQQNIATRTLRRVKSSAGILDRREGKRWLWRLPTQKPASSPAVEVGADA